MAVVIDEVQIEPGTQPANRGGDGGSGGEGSEGKKQPSPEEIARAIELQHERYERLRAY